MYIYNYVLTACIIHPKQQTTSTMTMTTRESQNKAASKQAPMNIKYNCK